MDSVTIGVVLGTMEFHSLRAWRAMGIASATWLVLMAAPGATATAAALDESARNIVKPAARAETAPVPHHQDAADDPAIWIHPNAPELSLILGTDKQGGLHIYNLDGTERDVIAHGSKPNNVDVLYGFEIRSRKVDLVVMTTRAEHARGIQVWAIDPRTREFSDVTAGKTIPVLGKGEDEPYGCCTYKNARSGAAYIFVTAKSGAVEQYALRANGGRVTAEKVSAFKLKSAVEACVADDELGVVYFGEEKRGIWKMAVEPSSKPRLTLIAKLGENGFREDVEGLAIYTARNGTGYLIVSSQGNNTFKIYERDGVNRFVATIDPTRGKFGDVQETDGIAVSSCPLPPLFPKGLFVAQDGRNGPATQNFKLFGWEDIAGTNLLIDTKWSPR